MAPRRTDYENARDFKTFVNRFVANDPTGLKGRWIQGRPADMRAYRVERGRRYFYIEEIGFWYAALVVETLGFDHVTSATLDYNETFASWVRPSIVARWLVAQPTLYPAPEYFAEWEQMTAEGHTPTRAELDDLWVAARQLEALQMEFLGVSSMEAPDPTPWRSWSRDIRLDTLAVGAGKLMLVDIMEGRL